MDGRGADCFKEEYLDETGTEGFNVQTEGLQTSTSFPVNFTRLTETTKRGTHHNY